MSNLGDLLELLHTAFGRSATVRAVLSKWTDQDLWLASAQRWQELHPPGTVSVMSSSLDAGRDTRRIEERTYRVWRDTRQDAWRVETEAEAGQSSQVTILNGGKWWSRTDRPAPQVPGWAAYAYTAGDYLTNVQPDGTADSRFGGSHPDRFIELMLDPASLLASMVFEPAGGSEWASRPAVDVLARWRKGIDLLDIEWPYADEVRMSADAEYGMLLRLEYLLDGKTFIRFEVEEIAFDEPLPAALFEGPSATPGQVLPDSQAPGQDAFIHEIHDAGKSPDA